MSAAAGGLLAWQFAQHWIAVCTASPLERRTAETLKQEWSSPLAISASVPLAMVVLGWLLGNALFPAVLLLLFATVQMLAFPWGNPLGKLRVFWNAIASWCSYNNDNLTLPGLLPSPAGSTGAQCRDGSTQRNSGREYLHAVFVFRRVGRTCDHPGSRFNARLQRPRRHRRRSFHLFHFHSSAAASRFGKRRLAEYRFVAPRSLSNASFDRGSAAGSAGGSLVEIGGRW